MKVKKAIGLALCVSMMLGCLSGCGDDADGGADDLDTNEYPLRWKTWTAMCSPWRIPPLPDGSPRRGAPRSAMR